MLHSPVVIQVISMCHFVLIWSFENFGSEAHPQFSVLLAFDILSCKGILGSLGYINWMLFQLPGHPFVVHWLSHYFILHSFIILSLLIALVALLSFLFRWRKKGDYEKLLHSAKTNLVIRWLVNYESCCLGKLKTNHKSVIPSIKSACPESKMVNSINWVHRSKLQVMIVWFLFLWSDSNLSILSIFMKFE